MFYQKTFELLEKNNQLAAAERARKSLLRQSRFCVERYIESTSALLDTIDDSLFRRRREFRLPRLGSVDYGNIRFVKSRDEEVSGVMMFRKRALADLAIEFYPQAQNDPMLKLNTFNEDCQAIGSAKRYHSADEIIIDNSAVIQLAEISAAATQAAYCINYSS